MKTSFFACGMLLICGVACGDDGVGGAGGNASSSSSATSTSGSSKASTSASGSSGSTTGTGTATGTGTGSSASSTTASATTAASSSSSGGNAMIAAAIDSGDFFANCMPAVPPDPLNGSVTVTYDNTGSDPGTVEVTSVDIVYTDGGETLTWTFEVMPAIVTVDANTMYEVVYNKEAGTGMATAGQGGPCSFCGGNGSASAGITVHALIDGVPTDASASLGQPQCAF